MNPHAISFEEIYELTRMHGFVCVTVPGVFSQDSNHGWGESCWRSLVSACGDRVANLVTEAQENGGRQTGWANVENNGTFLQRSAIENSEGQELVYFYK